MSKQKAPRLGCITVKPNGDYEITEIGLAHVRELATIGSSAAEIARYLGVSPRYIQKAIDPDSDRYNAEIDAAFCDGDGEFKKRLRVAQVNLSETNAQMAIHLGKHFLDQREEAQEINHNIRVVGTLPDYSASSDEWKRQFAPSALQSIDVTPKAHVTEAEIVED